jgi:hypothetical protein
MISYFILLGPQVKKSRRGLDFHTVSVQSVHSKIRPATDLPTRTEVHQYLSGSYRCKVQTAVKCLTMGSVRKCTRLLLSGEMKGQAIKGRGVNGYIY